MLKMINDNLLKRLEVTAYQPFPWLKNSKLQTIFSHYFLIPHSLTHHKQHIVSLTDGDKIVLVENQPTNWNPTQRILLLIHGLTGSHLSTHIVRLANKFVAAGYNVIRMNLRGCGTGCGLAKSIYHSGRSEDTRAALHWLKNRYPNSPVTQIGISLGGNITLKMAGEDGTQQSGNLDSVIAISPPLDLYASVQLIIHQANRMFNDHFVKRLLQEIKTLHGLFPELPPISDRILTAKNVYDFDDLYTAPRSGFKNAEDYYQRCSSWQFLENIAYPTFILHAKDDPVICKEKFFSIPKKDNFDILLTEQGGHVGWLGYTGKRFQYYWMDQVVLGWIKQHESRKNATKK